MWFKRFIAEYRNLANNIFPPPYKLGHLIWSGLGAIGITGTVLITYFRQSTVAFTVGCVLVAMLAAFLVLLAGIASERAKGAWVKLGDIVFDERSQQFVVTVTNIGRKSVYPRLTVLSINSATHKSFKSTEILGDVNSRHKFLLTMQGTSITVPLFQYSEERPAGRRNLLFVESPDSLSAVAPWTAKRSTIVVRLGVNCGLDRGNSVTKEFAFTPRAASDDYDVARLRKRWFSL